MRFVSLLGCVVVGVVGSSVGSSPASRLRFLFDSIGGFVNKVGSDNITQDIEKVIVESAIGFANNEGRELNHFVNLLEKVGENKVSLSSLESIKWKALDVVYMQAVEVQGGDKPSALDPKASSSTVLKEVNNEIVLGEKIGAKRSLEDNETTTQVRKKGRFIKDIKHELTQKIDKLVNHPLVKYRRDKRRDGYFYFSYFLHSLIQRKQFQLLLDFATFAELLFKDVAPHQFDVFEHVQRGLQDDKYLPAIPGALWQGNRKADTFLTRHTEMGVMAKRIAWLFGSEPSSDEETFKYLVAVEEFLFVKAAVENDWNLIQLCVDYGEYTFAFPKRVARQIFRRVYPLALKEANSY